MYVKGMTTRQLPETLEDIYDFEASDGVISDVTDKILPQIREYPAALKHWFDNWDVMFLFIQ